MLPRQQEEKRLFLEYQRTGDRRDRDVLIARFMPLARSLARRYHRGGEPLEDLEQVAALALVKAVDGFDPSRGLAFSSFAVPSITGALKRHYRDYGWSVRVPRDLQELAMRIQRINETVSTTTGASPTAAQIAEHAGITVEQVIEAREAHQALHADSLDQPAGSSDDDSGRATLLDTIGTRDMALRRAWDRMLIGSLLETLDERDRAIVQLYHLEGLTQAEIGERLGYSQMHISRLLRQATAKLAETAAGQTGVSAQTAA